MLPKLSEMFGQPAEHFSHLRYYLSRGHQRCPTEIESFPSVLVLYFTCDCRSKRWEGCSATLVLPRLAGLPPAEMSEANNEDTSASQFAYSAPMPDPPETHHDVAEGSAEEFVGRETRVRFRASFLVRYKIVMKTLLACNAVCLTFYFAAGLQEEEACRPALSSCEASCKDGEEASNTSRDPGPCPE